MKSQGHSQSLNDLLLRESPLLWLLIDTESLRIIDTSNSIETFGYSRVELIGAKISEICSGVLAIEENLGRVRDEVTEARFASWTFKARDGRIVEMLAAYRTLSLAAGERATIIFLIEETLRCRMNLREGNDLGAGVWI